jgi:hypothetical protein
MPFTKHTRGTLAPRQQLFSRRKAKPDAYGLPGRRTKHRKTITDKGGLAARRPGQFKKKVTPGLWNRFGRTGNSRIATSPTRDPFYAPKVLGSRSGPLTDSSGSMRPYSVLRHDPGSPVDEKHRWVGTRGYKTEFDAQKYAKDLQTRGVSVRVEKLKHLVPDRPLHETLKDVHVKVSRPVFKAPDGRMVGASAYRSMSPENRDAYVPNNLYIAKRNPKKDRPDYNFQYTVLFKRD